MKEFIKRPHIDSVIDGVRYKSVVRISGSGDAVGEKWSPTDYLADVGIVVMNFCLNVIFIIPVLIERSLHNTIEHIAKETLALYIAENYPEFKTLQNALKRRRLKGDEINAKDVVIAGDIIDCKIHTEPQVHIINPTAKFDIRAEAGVVLHDCIKPVVDNVKSVLYTDKLINQKPDEIKEQ